MAETMKLTSSQRMVLSDLNNVEKTSAYQLGMPVLVFRKLGAKGLAKCHGGSGHHSVWSITDAGRRALSEGGE